MNEFVNNLEFYIESYDIEKQLFLNGKVWFQRRWLEKSDFLQICLWKSRRPKKLYELNSEEYIINVTKNVFNENCEKTKINLLTSLKGVSIPTASAILSVTNPKDYPIIDIRCIQSLNDLKMISWSTININTWLEYLEIIRSLSKTYKLSAREIEKGLFSYNRIKLDKDKKNLYKY